MFKKKGRAVHNRAGRRFFVAAAKLLVKRKWADVAIGQQQAAAMVGLGWIRVSGGG
jgi:hypothetical protein